MKNFFVKLNLNASNTNVVYQIVSNEQKSISFDEFAAMCKYKKTVEDAKSIFKGRDRMTNYWKSGDTLYVLSFVCFYYRGRLYERVKAMPIVYVGKLFEKYKI